MGDRAARRLARAVRRRDRIATPRPAPETWPCSGACQLRFASRGALEVHRDGSRCLPLHVFEGLVEQLPDGRYCLRGAR